MTVLTARELNRATLARQMLLERADMTALGAVAHLGGLQAQEPQEPFIGLWSRLRGFAPGELSGLLSDRKVARTHMMRRTVHLLTTDDAVAWRPRHQAMLLQRGATAYRRELDGVDLEALASAGREVLADGQGRSSTDLARAVAERRPDAVGKAGPRALGEMLMGLIPMVQLPPRGLWREKGGVRNIPLAAWAGREVDLAAPEGPDGSDPVGRELVRRYLAAYGPASSADLRAWCGLAGLPGAVKAVRGELVSFRDERGRELLDLPDAPRPDPAVPAPVRFLPAFDNAILGYQDRSRIIDDDHRWVSVAGERVVLVDGRVSATWTVEEDTVVVTPLRALDRDEKDAVTAEGEETAAFLSEGGSRRVRVGEPAG